ncbi:MAG: DUF362 domain-containing protein, partial [Candidatus Binatia bacterium]
VKTFGEKKVGFLNLALDIAPWCDCIGFSDRPLVPNIGVFASFDPVALDAACVQKVQAAAGLPGSVAEDNGVLAPGTHKFTACSSFGGISEEIPLNTGIKNGLGSKEFELVEVPPAGEDGKFIYPTEICGPKFNKLFSTKPVVPEDGFKRVSEYDFAALEG